MPQSGREWAFVELLETTACPSSSAFPCDENKNKKCREPRRCSSFSFLAWSLGRTLRDGEVVSCPVVNGENVQVCCWTERKGDGKGMSRMVMESTEVLCAEKAFEVRHHGDSSEGPEGFLRLGVVRRKYRLDDIVIEGIRARVIQSLSSGGGGSILIHGAPGSGKTPLVLSILESLHCSMIKVSPGRLVAYAGTKADAALARAFAYARACGSHQIVIFLDNIDRLVPVLEGDNNNADTSDVDFGLLCRLMHEIGSSGLTVVATAVMPNAVDERVRRCFLDEILLQSPKARKMSGAAGTLEEEGCTISDDQGNAAAGGGRNPNGMVKHTEIKNPETRLSSVEVGGIMPDEQLLLPNRRWENIGGHAAIKQALMEAVVWPRCFPGSLSKLNIAPPCGILLHGPPGTGKTLLAHAAASAMKCQWVELRSSDVVRCSVGESEGIIRDAFAKAAECAPSLLFIDEFDALFSARGEGGVGSRLTSELLLCMDELQKFQKMGVKTGHYMALIAATNVLEAIDKAFLRPGRFDRTLFVDLPSTEDRLEILRIVSARVGGIEPGVDLGDLATITGGFSGADIVDLLSQASILQFIKQGGLEKASQLSHHLDHHQVEPLTLSSLNEALERYTNVAAISIPTKRLL